MKQLRLLITVMLLLLTAACEQQEQVRQAKFYAFSTEIDISLYGVSDEKAESTVKALEDSFDKDNALWHAWRPSTLTDINTAISQGKSITVSDNVAKVVQQAKALALESHNLFNPAAGKLFELWGYHRDDWFISRPPPAQADINKWLQANPTMADVKIDGDVISCNNKMVKLGFGGFAKGYAVNAAIDILKQHGIDNAIVNIGGDLRAIGSHGKRPWVIGIRHPRKEGTIASIDVHHDESVFTSGDYERYFTYKGVKYPHIMDPRTGYPAKGATSVTVMSQDAAKADAAATALVVAGEDWPQIAASMGVTRVMLVRPDGQIEMSPAMAERVHLVDNTATPVIRQIEMPTQP